MNGNSHPDSVTSHPDERLPSRSGNQSTAANCSVHISLSVGAAAAKPAGTVSAATNARHEMQSKDPQFDTLTVHEATSSRIASASSKRSLDCALPSQNQMCSKPKRRRESRVALPLAIGERSGSRTPHHPSPLFFSDEPHGRPVLPPRFSSSEAAARMLSNVQEEDNVKTVRLPRASMSPGSPRSPRRGHTRSSASLGRMSRSQTESILPTSSHKPHHSQLLGDLGIVELFDHDRRPTFIVDLLEESNYETSTVEFLYANRSMRNQPQLFQLLGSSDTDKHQSSINRQQVTIPFKTWLLDDDVRINPAGYHNNPNTFFNGANHKWTFVTLRNRFRVVSGLASSLDPEFDSPSLTEGDTATPSKLSEIESSITNNRVSPALRSSYSESRKDYFGSGREIFEIGENTTETSQDVVDEAEATISHHGRQDSSENSTEYSIETGSELFDWTRVPLSDSLSSHVKFARSIKWEHTSLGPIERWDEDLRQMCNMVMSSPHPAAMYWGEDLIAIYNEAYVPLAGQKHPALMGQSYKEAWAEIWEQVEMVFEQAQATGKATMKDDDRLFITRNNYLEETYFSWSIVPLMNKHGKIDGIYNPAFEKTRRKIAERRMLTLKEVGERTAVARDVKAFWTEVLAALESNECDAPLVLLYSSQGEMESDESSAHSTTLSNSKTVNLEGTLGVPAGHIAAAETIDLSGNEGFAPALREAIGSSKTTLLDARQGDFSRDLLLGLEERGFADPIDFIIVCPIHPTTGDSSLVFLIMGVNPRRPYDTDYSLFIQLLSRQLATSLASVVLFEAEIKRGQRAAHLAATEKVNLTQQLAERTQEARDSETKFTRMAEFAPVGMFIADGNGLISYANDTWYDLSGVPKGSGHTDRWFEWIRIEDRPFLQSLWADLVEKTIPTSGEFRFTAQWTDRHGTRGDTWVLFSAYPEKNQDGSLKSVFASITNISQQKWAEGLQKKKMEEAVELKRQQENFIDVTSHEMRNPLSAILQCADEICSSLTNIKPTLTDSGPSHEDIDGMIDAAQTISLCAQHQKRIVDDVLTMSKLDSALLMVTPVDVQPQTIVQKALKMFENELQNAGVRMKFVVDQSFSDLAVDWVKFDPSRVLQVLINLTTNAIKFTREKKGEIWVTVGASLERPSDLDQSLVEYFPPRRSSRADDELQAEWGDGETLYITFSVRDTGRGLTPEEKKMLFMRFSQASPRTHVQYGGSGLGLFISRELTELQGGQIGVFSEAGKGSTFAFYVKARRSTAPRDYMDLIPGMSRTDARKRSAQDDNATFDEVQTERKLPERPLSILIVEDNLVNQKVLQKQLKKGGFETYVANHGEEALERLEASWFWSNRKDDPITIDVVLMDQEMPVMDGLTCTKIIRELEESKKFVRHVPVIAVTANARNEQIKTAMEFGMDDVVSKPFRIPELVVKIEELLSKYPER